MNSVETLLAQLQAQAIQLWVEEERLRYRSPKNALTPELKQQLRDRKSEIIAFLQQQQSADIIPATEGNCLPLSFAQQRLWFLEQLEPGRARYHIPITLHLEGQLNLPALERSLETIINRHSILRTNFPTSASGQPYQNISPPIQFSLPLVDLQHLNAEIQKKELSEILTKSVQQPFDLATGSVLRNELFCLSPTEHILLTVIHHITFDGWSVRIWMEELTRLYEAFSLGQPSPLPELPIQYSDFSVWQRSRLQGDYLEQQLAYWRKQLSDAPQSSSLPTDLSRPAIQTDDGAEEFLTLSQPQVAALKQLGQQQEATLFMTLLTGFAILLSRYSRQTDLVIGSPIANRNRTEIENLIGFFVNSLALRIDLSETPTVADLIKQVRTTTLEAYTHQDIPFEKLVEELQPERDRARSPFFQVMFALQNVPRATLNLPDLKVSRLSLSTHTAKFDLTITLEETKEGLKGRFNYNTNLFEKATIAQLIKHYKTLLSAMTVNPTARVDRLSFLSSQEKEQVLFTWNQTQTNYPQQETVSKLFEKQAEKTPEATALYPQLVRCSKSQVTLDPPFAPLNKGSWGNHNVAPIVQKGITYQELNQQANQLAHYLQSSFGVQIDDRVGICVETTHDFLISALAILKLGAVYVPLDPNYPQERLQFMVSDAEISVLITRQSQLPNLSHLQIIDLDRQAQPLAQQRVNNLPQSATIDSCAYIIYTSGSTGKPKGVIVSHRAINRLVMNTNYITIQQRDRVAQASNISFDAATFEVWGALLNGATLIDIDRETLLSPSNLATVIKQSQIDILFLTTALFEQLAWEIPDALSSLKYLLFGGECVSLSAVKRLLETGKPQHLLHVYGPTENTTFSTWYPVETLAENAKTLPIGGAISNTQVYILDQEQTPVPLGIAGELYLGGDGVAQGYLNRPQLTGEKLIKNPFGEGKLYKTGDLARYLPDGNIEFIGRLDNQVKIRGFRIELGEIEAILSQHSEIREATVKKCQISETEEQLVAYIVSHNREISIVEEAKTFLQKQFPSYMIPSAFIQLEMLPLTGNGKIDKKALPLPTLEEKRTGKTFVPPRNEIERKLTKIWQELLEVNPISVEDNFFDLGGHSVLTVRLVAELEKG